MKAEKMDLLLKELGKALLPSLPGNFNQNVWREIRLRQASSQEQQAWLPELLASFLRPSPILAAVVVALAVGLAENYAGGFLSRSEKAAAALSLGIFNPQVQNLTLMARR